MMYFTIFLCLTIIMGILMCFTPDGSDEIFGALTVVCISVGLIFLILSGIVYNAGDSKYYYISGADGEILIKSDTPTNYILMINKRSSAWDFKSEVIEYKLRYMNIEKNDLETVVFTTEDKNKIIEYFSPVVVSNEEIFGGSK